MRDTRHIYKEKSGRLIASISINGRQHLKRVASKEQARQWFLIMETQSTKAAELTFAQLNDAANALDILKQANLTLALSDLATQFVKDRPCNGVRMTLGDAIREYVDRSKARVSDRTLKGYSTMLRHFKEDIGERTEIATFSKADAVRYLDRFLDKPPTWRSYHRTLSKFFAEAVKMDWCLVNPFSNLDAPKCKPPERKFLTVEDTRKALESVARRHPALIHFLTLGLFAGVRPIESLRLTAKHINLSTGYIHLSGDITKSHSYKERVVPINDTLRAWFNAFPFEDKPVPVNDICYVDRIIKECADRDRWERTPDNLRHSFATYQFALSRNSHETAMICGHAEAIAMKHYRGRVTREDAERFFSIVPALVCA